MTWESIVKSKKEEWQAQKYDKSSSQAKEAVRNILEQALSLTDIERKLALIAVKSIVNRGE